MKVLVICSKNSGKVAPFITDQVEALAHAGIICDYFHIHGKGFVGYLKNRRKLLYKIKEFSPSIIHAHYGLSGLLANTQRKIPVVTTYHGSDINNPKVFLLSRFNMLLSKWNIFVSQKNIDKSGIKKYYSLIPCGVDYSVFYPIDKTEARLKLNLSNEDKIVLFAGSFTNKVKNPQLAIDSVNRLPNVKLIELKGYSRKQVALLMNAVDVCLMTSFSEGSPQFIKEAMACNCPIVSVNVGDVEYLIHSVKNSFIVDYSVESIEKKLNYLLRMNERSDAAERLKVLNMDNQQVANNLISVYKIIKK